MYLNHLYFVPPNTIAKYVIRLILCDKNSKLSSGSSVKTRLYIILQNCGPVFTVHTSAYCAGRESVLVVPHFDRSRIESLRQNGQQGLV